MLYRKQIAKCLSLVMITAWLSAGCSDTDRTKPTKAPSSAPSIYVSTAETSATTTETTEETESTTTFSGDEYQRQQAELRQNMLNSVDYYNSLNNVADDTWCFIRKADHEPSGTYEYFKINDYHGYYINDHVDEDDKVLYLTFDCGYPTNRTESILDTLAKHNVKASFFVTKMYLEGCPEYAKRMKEEGHMVCNHTVHHEDLTVLEPEEIIKEIFDVSEYFYEITGCPIDPYFRTPTGSYTKRVMTMIADAGYQTMFWSLAYGDYDQNNQPAPGAVLEHFQKFHHNGAIVLMHNDSQSNVNELDDVLTYLEGEGYRFGLLDEIAPDDHPGVEFQERMATMPETSDTSAETEAPSEETTTTSETSAPSETTTEPRETTKSPSETTKETSETTKEITSGTTTPAKETTAKETTAKETTKNTSKGTTKATESSQEPAEKTPTPNPSSTTSETTKR